jgi:hypothetical protein
MEEGEMNLNTRDVVTHPNCNGLGTVVKVYEDGESLVKFSDGEYVLPTESFAVVEQAPQPVHVPKNGNGTGTGWVRDELTEDQEAFLTLKTATVQEVMELCDGDISAETIQRNLRALRTMGYRVSQSLNEEGFAEYSLLLQEKGHIVNPVKQQDVLNWWKEHKGLWLHDRDATLGLGLSINKQCAVALARRVLTTAGEPFQTRQVGDSRKFEFCYGGN